jgi:RecA-family ATPase
VRLRIINNNYKFVVIDSLYRTGWLTEENSNDSTSKELGDLQGLAEETGAAIMLVDHTAKGGGKDKQVVDAARGASAKILSKINLSIGIGGVLPWLA